MKQKLIAKIHIIKNKYKLDDDVYRDILLRVTGKESTKSMRIKQLIDVVEEFKRLGYNVGKNSYLGYKSPKFRYIETKCPKLRKIFKLWNELGELKIIRECSNEALSNFMLNRYGCSYEDINEPNYKNDVKNKTIEALKSWRSREAKKIFN